MKEPDRFMRMAISLARKGLGCTSPNPAVGAVLVRGGRVVGRGYHQKAGEPHAEILALREAGARARGADLVVILEPCCHVGKTPPCTDALLEAGIGDVVVGMLDPNPLVAGKGVRCLRRAGRRVEVGVLERECRRLNEAWIKYVTTGLPFVTMKAAATLDGVIAAPGGDSKWITGEKARRHVHGLRACSDAVMVGAGTVLQDDPELTVRMARPKGQGPIRVVVDEDLRIPDCARMLTDGKAPTVVITTGKASGERIRRLRALEGVEVIVARSRKDRASLRDALRRLGRTGVVSVLLEGGSLLNASALEEGVVDRIMIYYAPKIAGGSDSIHLVGGRGPTRIADALRLEDLEVRRIGDDVMITGLLRK